MGTDLSITAALQKSHSTAHARVDRTEPISHTALFTYIGVLCPQATQWDCTAGYTQDYLCAAWGLCLNKQQAAKPATQSLCEV